MDDNAIMARYPRLLVGMRFVACLSTWEAVACLRDYRAGHRFSGEAVDHFGGPEAVLRAAARANVRSVALDMRRAAWDAALTELVRESNAAGWRIR